MHVQYGESESENWLVSISLTAADVQEFYDYPEQLLVDSNKEIPPLSYLPGGVGSGIIFEPLPCLLPRNFQA